ncbi:Ubiquitin-like protein [Mizuhopecten yessoensis]|uniref:Ubiquitin-like protein n=1 Tax=Mizuhopecten yessoensis TaxID=6573 RepID=A0A210QMM8_MIZYE|nr:Ubiquitin-like protein [Mizuhopecten yessoensis]
MQIMVQAGTDGKTQLVDAEPSESMASLFQKISDQRGVEKQYLQIVYAGKTFRPGDARTDHKTIADLGMKDRSLVQLVTRLPGGQ